MGAILDAALQRAFGDSGERIRFIQVGGNDGVHEDPLHPHRINRAFDFEWGHIYEPIPEYFEQLAQNMAPFPYITCHQLAVDDAEQPGTRAFNYVSPLDVEGHRLPGSSRGIGSFSRDRNALGGFRYGEAKFRAIENYIRTIEVETVPVTDVIRQFADANLFLTDCEGHDLEIVDAAFRRTDFRPKVIQFEYLGLFDELFNSVLTLLQGIGYVVARSGKDVICEWRDARESHR